MTLMSWALGACLLIHGCLSITGDTERGCKIWTPMENRQDDVCCDECHPGNRMFKRCGPDPKDLCTPCEDEYYSRGPKEPRCYRCTQCFGDQFPEKPCTRTTDTVCGCREGLRCGNDACSFCVQECGKGEEPEPAPGRSCSGCRSGTFNDQIHQKCKPWTTRCPNPDEYIVTQGNAVSDSKCRRHVMALRTVTPPMAPTTVKTSGPAGKDKPGDTEETWPVLVCVLVPSVAFMAIWIIMAVKIIHKRKTKWVPKTIIRSPEGDDSNHFTYSDAPRTSLSPSDDSRTPLTPSDQPRTLIVTCDATESSYHEPEVEHGSSTESLASKDSKTQLIV